MSRSSIVNNENMCAKYDIAHIPIYSPEEFSVFLVTLCEIVGRDQDFPAICYILTLCLIQRLS